MKALLLQIHTEQSATGQVLRSGRRGATGLLLAMFVVFVMSMSVPAVVGAGIVKQNLSSRIQQVGMQEEVPVIITLSDQLDLKTFSGGSKKMQRANMHAALKSKAEKTQKNLRKVLQTMKAGKVVSFWLFNGMAATVPAGMVKELAKLPEVHSVQLDGVITLQAPVPATAAAVEWNVDAIGAPALWNLGYDGTGVVVANMDTGVDAAHQDLLARWRGGSNSWYDPNGEHTTPYDKNGHGTQTMGVMVGGDAGGSAIGVAPGASWIAVKIFNDLGQASYSAIHQGFQWLLDPDGDPVTDDLPDIVNNSWGFDEAPDQCLSEFQLDIRALRTAGVAVVFSSGNTGPNSSTSISPANYPESFAVGAVDDLSNIADFSGRGPAACSGNIYPDVVAPGVNVKAPDLTFGVNPGAYAYVSGTSIAAPLVSGGMALLLSANQQLTVDELETSIAQSAADLGVFGADYTYGNGLVDVAAAYALIDSGQGLCTDKDGDGFSLEVDCPGVQDCNDGDAAVYPGAVEIKHDGIDQDCNGYDLTIDIVRSDYRELRDGLVFWAASDLMENALLQVEIPGVGIQPMTWSVNRQLWKNIVRYASQNGFDPAVPGQEIIVNGHEGVVNAPVTTK